MVVSIIALSLASIAYTNDASFDANEVTSGIISQERLPNTSVNTLNSQTIDGVKTFLQPLVGDGSNFININASNVVGTLDTANFPPTIVNTVDSQTIDGQKTFLQAIIAPNIPNSLSKARYFCSSTFTTNFSNPTNPEFILLPLSIDNQIDFKINTVSQITTITYTGTSSLSCAISLSISVSYGVGTFNLWIEKNAGLLPVLPNLRTSTAIINVLVPILYQNNFQLENGDTLNICGKCSNVDSLVGGYASLIIS